MGVVSENKKKEKKKKKKTRGCAQSRARGKTRPRVMWGRGRVLKRGAKGGGCIMLQKKGGLHCSLWADGSRCGRTEGEKDVGFGNNEWDNYLVTSDNNLKLAGGFLVANG
jgi:hypothetical protein